MRETIGGIDYDTIYHSRNYIDDTYSSYDTRDWSRGCRIYCSVWRCNRVYSDCSIHHDTDS